MTPNRCIKSLCMVVLVLASTSAAHARTSWLIPEGDADSFHYSNGHDENGRFGNPTVTGDTLTFPGSTWSVNATAGMSVEEFDTLMFDLQVNDGLSLLSTGQILVYGLYNTSGTGSLVDAQLTLSIKELGGLERTFTANLASTPTFPVVNTGTPETNGWVGMVGLELPYDQPLIHNELRVELTNTIRAKVRDGGEASISETYPELALSFHFTPEPTTLSLLIAMIPFLRRRRNRGSDRALL